MTRWPIVFIVVVLALGLAACGGTSETTGETGPATSAEVPDAGSADDGRGSTEGDDTTDSGGGGNGSEAPAQEGDRDQSDEPKSEQKPNENEKDGGGRPPPDSSQSEEAKRGIRGYGTEASAAERETVSRLVEDFMQGREDQDWEVVCGAIAKPVIAPLERLASRNPQLKGKGCVALLTLLGRQGSSSDFQSNAAGSVASFRVKGERGFAIYDGTGGGEFALLMLREGGDWKVGSFSSRELA